MSKVVYLIGSLRNGSITGIGQRLREATGFEIFDDWYTASEDADDWLRDHYKVRGLGYRETIHSPAARHIFDFDYTHLNRADIGVLVMPGGKSAHLELGFMIGQGKKGFVLFDHVPERVDIMYNFATDIFFNEQELIDELRKHA